MADWLGIYWTDAETLRIGTVWATLFAVLAARGLFATLVQVLSWISWEAE